MATPIRTGFTLNRDDEVRYTKVIKELERIPLFASQELKHLASQAEGRAKRNATRMGAVDSGRLRRNIKVRPTSNNTVKFESIAVNPKTGESYASTVHNGLARSGKNAVARPYLGLAFEWMGLQFRKRMVEKFKRIG